MKRVLMLCCVLISILICLMSCLNKINKDITLKSEITNDQQKDGNLVNEYKLIVQGQNITQKCYLKDYNDSCYVELPFINVMKALGADIKWQNKNTAEISLNDQKYILNTENANLVREGSTANCIIPIPGGKVHYRTIENELMLDDATVKTAANIMGISITIDVREQINCVIIKNNTGDGSVS